MGAHLSIYIGAYLVITSREKITEYGPQKCTNHPEESFSDAAMRCSVCGNNLVRKESIRKATWYELFPNDEDYKYEELKWIIPDDERGDDTRTFICVFGGDNKNNLNHIKHELEYGGDVEITPEMAAQSISNFKATYHEIIKILEGKSVDMSIKFGVVTDES